VELTRGAVVTASINDPTGKPRPFLVLRSDRFAGHTLVMIMAFTSTLTDAPSLRVSVEPTAVNGLLYRSQAMIDHIQSVRVQRIGRIIGKLAETDMQGIASAVAVYLGFGDGAPVRGTVPEV